MCFSQPKPPDIAGLDELRGHRDAHRALGPRPRPARQAGRDHRHGASAVQVIPSIAPEVEQLDGLPAHADLVPAQARQAAADAVRCMRRLCRARELVGALASQAFVELTFPLPRTSTASCRSAKLGERVGRWHLREQVHDPVLRDKLTPRYALGCKRPGFSNDYLRTFNRANVAARDRRRSSEITATGLRTADGTEHEVDTLILATGFKVFEPRQHAAVPGDRPRRGGSRALVGREPLPGLPGRQRARASPTCSRSSAPTPTTARSYFTLIENQSRHIVRCLRQARRTRATSVEVTPRGQPTLLQVDARPAQEPGLLHGQLRGRRTATTSTTTATRRSGPRPRSRRPGAARASTWTTTASPSSPTARPRPVRSPTIDGWSGA